MVPIDGPGTGPGTDRVTPDPDPLDTYPDLTRLAAQPSRPVDVLGDLVRELGLAPRAAASVLVVLVVLAAGAWWWWHDPPPSAAEASMPLAQPLEASATATATTVPTEVVAHAAGAVVTPGVYTLAAGARIADLIDAAGGALPRADLDRVNLAAPIGDGAQVYVPRLGEASAPAPIGGQGGDAGDDAPTTMVDLNTASAEDLETLPGVGPATSAAIIAHREENGPFASVDDLIAVPGIGDAKMAALRDLVSV